MNYTIKSNIKTTRNFNTDLFKSDSEPMDNFIANEWDIIDLVSTDTLQDRFKETIVLVSDDMAYLLNHTRRQGFGGKIESTFWIQELTMKGMNYFTKESDKDYSEYYNKLIAKYGFTVEDIKEIGEFKTEYDCFTLAIEDNNESVWLTVNNRNQLSSITIKPKALEAQPTVNEYEEEVLSKSILG